MKIGGIMADIFETSFGLILNAGNSKSKSMMAIEAAREFDFEEAPMISAASVHGKTGIAGFDFEEADKLVKEAEEDLRLAHQTQTDLIQGEARGEKSEVSVILVHSQDHLTTAMIMLDQAKEFINVYQMLSKILSKEGN